MIYSVIVLAQGHFGTITGEVRIKQRPFGYWTAALTVLCRLI